MIDVIESNFFENYFTDHNLINYKKTINQYYITKRVFKIL